jgi:putative transposon-encoded protein
MSITKKSKAEQKLTAKPGSDKIKFEVYGEEMVEKVVKLSGNSGRIYLPAEWLGCRAKIIRID